ncbi:sister chromatid cohesion protein Dcc1 [Lipomyces oligophaga]|uniref:sister chromatid cohesion protein Dcc1 n=1 Tax=Lipomyces oligophaga TaxID=45792 RepID=UPI0034CE9CD8
MNLSPALLSVLDDPDERGHLRLAASSFDEPLFLCSRTKTFRIRQINQSNTLLIVEKSTTVKGNDPAVRISKLPGTMLESVLTDNSTADISFLPEYDCASHAAKASKGTAYTWQDVKARVPVSDRDLEVAKKVQLGVEALPTDGNAWRLSSAGIERFLPLILEALHIARLSPNKLRVSDVVEALKDDNDSSDECEPKVIAAVLRRFSDSYNEPYNLDMAEISRWFGLRVLSEQVETVKVSEFLTAWADALPPVLDAACDLACLAGEFVQPTTTTIRYLPSSGLPSEPSARFRRLFAVKSTWELDDILPYVKDIEKDKIKINSLLMKHTRRRVVKGKTYIDKR